VIFLKIIEYLQPQSRGRPWDLTAEK